MKRFVLTAVMAAFGGVLAAKPPGDPVNPHGMGKEGTPVEREFYLLPPADAPLTQTVPQRPTKGAEIDVWAAVKALFGVR